jgi:two-component system, OmpR family, response regulator CpxR
MPTNEKRVLIVDDDDAIRALLFTILRRRRFAVDAARNGVEALSRLRRCQYAVILLDLMMPMKSGWEVLDELQKLPAAARPVVIVLTAGNEPRDLDPKLIAASISKPFDVEMLMETVMACTNALIAQPQLPDCPPDDSAPVTRPEKVN